MICSFNYIEDDEKWGDVSLIYEDNQARIGEIEDNFPELTELDGMQGATSIPLIYNAEQQSFLLPLETDLNDILFEWVNVITEHPRGVWKVTEI